MIKTAMVPSAGAGQGGSEDTLGEKSSDASRVSMEFSSCSYCEGCV